MNPINMLIMQFYTEKTWDLGSAHTVILWFCLKQVASHSCAPAKVLCRYSTVLCKLIGTVKSLAVVTIHKLSIVLNCTETSTASRDSTNLQSTHKLTRIVVAEIINNKS